MLWSCIVSMRMSIKLKPDEVEFVHDNVWHTVAGYKVDNSLSYTVHTSLQDGVPYYNDVNTQCDKSFSFFSIKYTLYKSHGTLGQRSDGLHTFYKIASPHIIVTLGFHLQKWLKFDSL